MKDALDPRRFDAIIHNDPCRSPRRQPDNNKIVPLPTKWQHMKINTRRQSASINLCRHWSVGDLWPSRITISPWAEKVVHERCWI